MIEQMVILGVSSRAISEAKKKERNQKTAWGNAFQRWSDNCDDTTAFGKCGYGCICDYCEDNSYGRPCVRALNALCRDKHITIDYQERNFEEVFTMADRMKGDKK